MAWRDAALARLRALPNVKLCNRMIAFGFYDHNLVALAERLSDHLPPQQRQGPRQRLWKVRAGKVILATGTFERPIPFAGNDLPGVMLASAAQVYARRFGAVPGQRIVVCTNNDSAYAAARALHAVGCASMVIVDSRGCPGAPEENIVIRRAGQARPASWREHLAAVQIERAVLFSAACQLPAFESGRR